MVPPLDIHLGTTFPWALVRRPPWHHLNCGEYGVTVFLCGHCLSLHHHWGCRLPEGPPPMTPPDAFVPATPPGPPPLGALPLTPPEAWWPESPPHTPEGAWQTCYCGCLSNQPSRLMFSLSMHTSISTCFCWLIVTRLNDIPWLDWLWKKGYLFCSSPCQSDNSLFDLNPSTDPIVTLLLANVDSWKLSVPSARHDDFTCLSVPSARHDDFTCLSVPSARHDDFTCLHCFCSQVVSNL